MQPLINTLARPPLTRRQSHNMMRLHETLNARRIELGLTYEQVQERLDRYPWPAGIAPPKLPTVGHWFNGTRRPRNMQHLRGLCDVLDLSIDEAVKGAPNEAQTGVEQRMLDLLRSISDADGEMLLAMGERLKNPR
jgi:transcriptional regulator with XRE-family HTH domain